MLRQTQQSDDGDAYYKVTYPKFKLGEEVVREVAVPPTYGKLHNTVRPCQLRSHTQTHDIT